MSIRGAKPKPTEQKRLEGNAGRRPLNDEEPQPEAGAPDMPEDYSEREQAEWELLCNQLSKMGILVKSDRALMMLYVDTIVDYIEARRRLHDVGMVAMGEKSEYMSPWFNVSCALKKQLLCYAAELGMSPVARTRIKVIENKATGKEKKYFNRETAKVVG